MASRSDKCKSGRIKFNSALFERPPDAAKWNFKFAIVRRTGIGEINGLQLRVIRMSLDVPWCNAQLVIVGIGATRLFAVTFYLKQGVSSVSCVSIAGDFEILLIIRW